MMQEPFLWSNLSEEYVMKPKIGLTTSGFEGWSGGFDFFENLIAGICAVGHPRELSQIYASRFGISYLLSKYAAPVLTAGRHFLRSGELKYNVATNVDPADVSKTLAAYIDKANLINVAARWSAHERAAVLDHTDVLIPCMKPPSAKYKGAWVGYLYDCQHKHYPEFFSQREISARDKQFQQMLDSSDHVMVNSRAVISDISSFYGLANAKLHSLPFAPILKPEHLQSKGDCRSSYGINRPYFIVCNQFWKHKNHLLLFKAFAKFYAQTDQCFQLVCTGSTLDYRFPGYFGELQAYSESVGGGDAIRILGRIPRLDQISLMRRAIAVVQPTLFEGGPGGGSAYDSVALGLPLILSDISVNKEVISDHSVTYFDPFSVDSLELALHHISQKPLARVCDEVLLQTSRNRAITLGNALLNICKTAVEDLQRDLAN